jgi:hypothetical protein
MQNAIQNIEKTSLTKTQIQQKLHQPKEMPRLPIKMHRANRQNTPHKLQRTYTSN